MSEVIVNKVAESGLITLDPATFIPKEVVKAFDLKDFLFMGMILKEKDFRESLASHEWEQYRGALVAVFCSADAIIPHWAYMLVATHLENVAGSVYAGTEDEAVKARMIYNIQRMDIDEFRDKRMVIKGCGDKEMQAFVYFEITKLLKPVVKSIMYGEPCSTVPVYKRK